MKRITFALLMTLLPQASFAQPAVVESISPTSVRDGIKAAREADRVDEQSRSKSRPWDRDPSGKRPWDRPEAASVQK
jgi:hypothetical protein